jgi:SAM-dependent methyltransferase
VFEHLRDPWQAVSELARVLSPGGFVYADWNFVFAYHGYPAHYFNASADGVREAFARHLDVVDVDVAPFQGPGAALRQVIGTYLRHAQATDADTRALRHALEGILLRPLETLDRAIPPEDRHRIAAGVHVLAHKPGRGPLALIPDAIWEAWANDAALRARYPDPRRLAEPSNIIRVCGPPAAASASTRFSKDGSGRARDAEVDAWPDQLLTEPESPADADLRRVLLARRRPWLIKLADATARPADLLRLPSRALRWVRWRVQYARGRTP